jgi:hypothetical protein
MRSAGCSLWLITKGPHAFEIVKAAHLWPEDVDDDILSIDQNPIGTWQAFNTSMTPSLFDPLDKLLRNGSDLPTRTTACDHHMVCNAAFAFEGDGDDILCLIIIKRLEDELVQGIGIDTRSLFQSLFGRGFARRDSSEISQNYS